MPHYSIDFDLLKQELSENIVEGPQERYQLNWPGKRESIITANVPIAKTLRPCRDESVNFDTTKNLFIEGDNLDALKLLQESYLNKVKMIYIDPPYNTGNDFIYEDHFSEGVDEYLKKSNQKDEAGNKLVANTESNGRFHSDWLSMIYPRLKLARDLLRDDGVIFISIDDNEVGNLRKICDEIFGERNFIANIVWQKKYSTANDSKGIAAMHDHIIAFSKSFNFKRNLLSRTEDTNKPYKNDDKDGRGLYRTDNLLVKTFNKNSVYPIINNNTNEKFYPQEGSCWRFNIDKMKELIEENRIYFGKDGKGAPQLKRYLNEVQQGVVPTTWWSYDNAGHNDEASKELKEIFESKSPFNTPKPTKLIKKILFLSTSANSEDLIIDFFAGSSTTAHAVMQLNAEDNGNRKFIMVQLPEACDEKSEAYKAGYKTIAEISKERIRRAGKKRKEDNAKKESIENLDIGFRVLKVDSSNMNDVYYTPEQIKITSLFQTIENIKSDRSNEDLLFQVLLDCGVELSLKIIEKTIQTKKIFFVEDNALIACFDKEITEDLLRELAQEKPMRIVFRDNAFASDQVKINASQIFKQLSPESEIKTI